MAIPLIGSGGQRLSHTQVADEITSRIIKSIRSSNDSSSLNDIRLVVFKDEHRLVLDKAVKLSIERHNKKEQHDREQLEKEHTQNKRELQMLRSKTQEFSTLELPKTWSPMQITDQVIQVEVPSVDSVFQKFHLKCKKINKRLVRLFRIQNPTLYRKYILTKNEIESKYANAQGYWLLSPILELSLFHGTLEDSIQKINRDGFDRSYSGSTNGTIFGHGVYFARELSYAAQDLYSKPNLARQKCVYSAKVLVGLSCPGNKEMRHLPENQQANRLQFDSAVDQMQNPSIYVVFKDMQAYPEYLLILSWMILMSFAA